MGPKQQAEAERQLTEERKERAAEELKLPSGHHDPSHRLVQQPTMAPTPQVAGLQPPNGVSIDQTAN